MPTPGRTADYLARIAAALGCSPADLMEGSSKGERDGLTELLKVWSALDAAGRQRLVASAREIAGETMPAVEQAAE